MANAVDCRKILEALRALLPAMNEQEISGIAQIVYAVADRLEKEQLSDDAHSTGKE